MYKKRNKGFTLLELLVVIGIIGILSAITLTAMSTARASGRDGKRISDIRQIQNALEIYYSTYKAYPAALSNLTTSTPVSIKSVPLDPKTGVAYFYIPLSSSVSGSPCNGYHVGADLEVSNKVLSTDSDVNSSTIISGSPLKCNSATAGLNGGNGVFPNTGTAESSAGCSGATGLYCYDLKK